MTKLHLGFHMDDPSQKIEIPVKTLKRHFAALGASGSGKTVLVKVVLEECIRQQIPVIIVDIQGDLASLSLMGDKKVITEKGVPGSYWDDYKKKAQVAIFTPASTKGIPISMNPLRTPPQDLDPEDLIQATDIIASAITSIVGYDPGKPKGGMVKDYLFTLLQAVWNKGEELEDFTGLANAVLEDQKYLDAAGSQLLDDKEKAKLARAIRGKTVGADSLLFNLGMPLDIEKLLTWADKGKTPVNILYLNTLRSVTDRQNFIATLANETYSWMLRHPSSKLQLVFLLDELAGLMPPIGNPPTKQGIMLLMKQARKYGVSMLLATQNISDVDYKSLAQVGTWALGRIMTQQDLNKVKQIIEAISPAEADLIISRLPRLKAGQFMLLAPDVFDKVQPLQCRWLLTDHKTLDEASVKRIMDESGLRDRFPTGERILGKKRKKGEKVEKKGKKEKEEEEAIEDVESEEGLDLTEAEEKQLVDAEPETVHTITKAPDVPTLLDANPIAFTIPDIAADTNIPETKVKTELKKLEKTGAVQSAEYDGEKVYWSKKHKLDPNQHIVGPLFRFHLNIRKGEAKKIVKKNMPKTLGIRALEEIIDDETKLVYIPLWRIGVKYRVERKSGFIIKRKRILERTRMFFVNGLTGKITVYDPKEETIRWEDEELDDVEKTETLPKEVILDTEELEGLRRTDLRPKISRERAMEQVTMLLGARINRKIIPVLAWYPVWEYKLKDKDTGDTRHVWVDGVFGTYMETSPAE